ncbi:Coenzyme F420 hydrogenase/dehydrogenase, beta subunit C-terminal domain [Thermosulfuriphilus sp.]
MSGAVIEADLNKAGRRLLSLLLEAGLVKGVISHQALGSDHSFVPILTRDKEKISQSYPVPPTMPMQMARVISRMTLKGPLRERIAVILRPCEMAALVELVKLKQAHLQNVLTISLDCPGVITLRAWRTRDRRVLWQTLERIQPRAPEVLRSLCQICSRFTSQISDLTLATIGVPDNQVALLANSLRGEEILKALEFQTEEISGRQGSLELFLKERRNQRERAQEIFSRKISGVDGLLDSLSSCINCRNCMRVCLICFCRECFFDSEAFRSPADNYLRRAQRKGGLRLPPDMLLFHLGRMNHIGLSCVSCGMCEDACPAGIPISRIFSLIAQMGQELFSYQPGRLLDEPLPLTTYQEEELEDFEAPYRETWSPKL